MSSLANENVSGSKQQQQQQETQLNEQQQINNVRTINTATTTTTPSATATATTSIDEISDKNSNENKIKNSNEHETSATFSKTVIHFHPGSEEKNHDVENESKHIDASLSSAEKSVSPLTSGSTMPPGDAKLQLKLQKQQQHQEQQSVNNFGDEKNEIGNDGYSTASDINEEIDLKLNLQPDDTRFATTYRSNDGDCAKSMVSIASTNLCAPITVSSTLPPLPQSISTNLPHISSEPTFGVQLRKKQQLQEDSTNERQESAVSYYNSVIKSGTVSASASPNMVRKSSDGSVSLPRRVSFPKSDNELVTGYLEPANPWEHGKL